ncbi:MAG: pyrroline-5-carboxylate reductase [Candidatus Omnitrophica bacterium]|nr:pyrroline-5-carboxylate reductase [Candidatus Omnitrophota bacterium]
MFKFLRKKIGIIGCGNMGKAVAERTKSKYRVFIFDKDANKLANLSGIEIVKSNTELIRRVDVVILAIKPQDFLPLLEEIKDNLNGKLIISIAAGITTKYIENVLGAPGVIRVMPNIGAVVGKSVSYICKGSFAGARDLKLSIKIFNSIGHTFALSEELMNAATAVGGSGPGFWGYLFDKQPQAEWNKYKTDYFIPEFTSAAKSVGFNDEAARLAADCVTTSSISVTEALHITPGELAKRVASKGGTTEAGIEVLRNGGSLTDAVRAALKRAGELSRG